MGLECIKGSIHEVIDKKKLKAKQNYRNRKLNDEVSKYEIETKKIKQNKTKKNLKLNTTNQMKVVVGMV